MAFCIFNANDDDRVFKILSNNNNNSNITRIPVCRWLLFCCWLILSEATATATATVLQSQSTTAPSPSIDNKTPSKQSLIIIVTVSALIFFVFMGFLTFLRSRIIRRKTKKGGSSKRVEDAEMPPTDLIDVSGEKNTIYTTTTTTNLVKMRRFSLEEMVKMSKNFSTVIGRGGLSTVYLGYFSSKHDPWALKIYQKSERLNGIFKEELDILLHLHHPNIIKILGYYFCHEYNLGEDEMIGSALVFEYLPNGNLQEKLHGNPNGSLLSWKSRMWIAFQLARAIEYLHHKCTLPIVHGDIKAANVLLDDQLNCKLCDFGSAKMGFSSTILPSLSSPRHHRSLMGSPGYIDPHYLRTGIASKKNDVFSFGVILLELITGMEAFCPDKEQLLTTIAGPILREDKVDPRPLMSWTENLNHSDTDEVMVMASIAARCVRQQPSLRPSMTDIITTMTNEISSISSFHAADKRRANSMCN